MTTSRPPHVRHSPPRRLHEGSVWLCAEPPAGASADVAAIAEAADPRGAEHEASLARIGSTLGSYRLLARIGKGGMGFVYRAEHVRLGRAVAIKVLRSDYSRRKDAVARFFQEARTVNLMRHRNIVDVTDFVELDDGTTFIVMELLSGQSLGAWASEPVEVPRALALLLQICDGLAAAHAVNIVHRDLKPDNIFVAHTADGIELVKLLDFGVAKLLHHAEGGDFEVLTRADQVIGTPAFMSPEQVRGLPIDGRSDIYSLGAIMYQLFCGQPMFRGRSFAEFARQHLREAPIPPRATAGGATMDPQLEAIILRAVEKDPGRRYQTIFELREALLSALATQGVGRGSIPPAISLRVPHRASRSRAADAPLSSAAGAGLTRPGAPVLLGSASARTSSWSVWLVGGATAITLGVGGAFWYSASQHVVVSDRPGTPTIPAVTELAISPSVPVTTSPAPVPDAAPVFVELGFRSDPSNSGVFREGSGSELCRTPCSLQVDLRTVDDAIAVRFLLRHVERQDTTLTVNLRAPQREFLVALPTSTAAAAREVPGGHHPAASEAARSDADRSPPRHRGGHHKSRTRPRARASP
jgi:eukaryotic-like serine/threonine-protein kinase